MRHTSASMTLILAVSVMACQSPTNSSNHEPVSPPPAAGSLVLKNESPDGLTLSAYAPPGTGAALVTAPLVPAGKTTALTVVPVSQDLIFKVKSDAADPVIYTLVSDAQPAVFNLSPLRAYNLDLTMDTSAPPEMVWSWQLAANPAYEVSNLQIAAGINSLNLTWIDPSLPDFTGLSVKVTGRDAVVVDKGEQSLAVTGLSGGVPVSVRVSVVYPEIISRGTMASATPQVPAVVVVPEVNFVSPSDGTPNVYALPGTVTAYFKTSLDATTITSDTFQVSDGTAAVPGTLSVSGTSATFTPVTNLTPGKTHTVKLTTGIKSLSGGVFAADYQWSFTTRAAVTPTIDSTWPANNAIDIDYSPGTVTVDFLTNMYKPSINASTFIVSDGETLIPGTISFSSLSAIFTPSTPLADGKLYTATLKPGIFSLTGAPLAEYSWHFTSKASSFFDALVLLPLDTRARAAALADVTGDGKPDIIGLTGNTSGVDQSDKLVVFSQTNTGWGSAVFYSTTGTGHEPLSSLAVGDLNGDGKAEVMVAEKNGIEIFKQNGTGELTLDRKLTSLDSYSIQVGDLNNDGRTDLAGIGDGTVTVSVWTQKSDGTLNSVQTYPAAHGGYDGLGLGDTNDDGLTDLIVRSGQSYSFPSLQVLTQTAAGAFNVAIPLSIGASKLADGVVVGDLTGDGKDDVVVSYDGGDGKVGLFVQNAGALSTTMVSYPTYDNPTAMVIADINADSKNDLVIFHNGRSNVGVHLQKSDGNLDTVEHLSPVGSIQAFTPGPMMVGDLNSDGKPDLVVATDAGMGILFGK